MIVHSASSMQNITGISRKSRAHSQSSPASLAQDLDACREGLGRLPTTGCKRVYFLNNGKQARCYSLGTQHLAVQRPTELSRSDTYWWWDLLGNSLCESRDVLWPMLCVAMPVWDVSCARRVHGNGAWFLKFWIPDKLMQQDAIRRLGRSESYTVSIGLVSSFLKAHISESLHKLHSWVDK